MDQQTLEDYIQRSDEYIRRYDDVEDGISTSFAAAFRTGDRILDVGCGSGRDLRMLHELGFDADGVDPCPAFVAHTQSTSLGYNTKVARDALPELSSVADQSYDGVLCSAVLMHVPEELLFDAVFSIRRVLKTGGRVLLSVPLVDETIDPVTSRDAVGRLFSGVSPGQLELLFERVGFRLMTRSRSKDGLGRDHRRWETMLFELQSAD